MPSATREGETRVRDFRGALRGLRIAVCGKGGSGKSSLVALMAAAMRGEGYQVLVLDGDASNPGGVTRLLTGGQTVRPLIEFFGGREKVTCPVDDPSPLTRIGDHRPVPERNIDLSEVPPEYFIEDRGVLVFQVGKIKESCEGCDGPMSKVTRDFIVRGDRVTLIDLEAGIEHFGRGVEKQIDVVLVVVDPTLESISIAERASGLCNSLGIEKVLVILNKVDSSGIESLMMGPLTDRKLEVLGSVDYDPLLLKAGLIGTPLPESTAAKWIREIVGKLEAAISTSSSEA